MPNYPIGVQCTKHVTESGGPLTAPTTTPCCYKRRAILECRGSLGREDSSMRHCPVATVQGVEDRLQDMAVHQHLLATIPVRRLISDWQHMKHSEPCEKKSLPDAKWHTSGQPLSDVKHPKQHLAASRCHMPTTPQQLAIASRDQVIATTDSHQPNSSTHTSGSPLPQANSPKQRMSACRCRLHTTRDTC